MNSNTVARRPRLLVLATLVFAMFGSLAHAQLSVQMAFNKKNYVEHEAIIATVKVKNLAGHDLILSGPDGSGWLNFDVRVNNHGLSQRRDAPRIKPRALKAGAIYETSINLGRYYPMANPSNYAITASVYYPPLKRYFPSRRSVINVLRAKTLWTQSFGVPQGNNRPVEFRKYSLLSFRDRNSSLLYVRLSTQDNAKVFTTQSLGNVLRSFEPNIDVDSQNRLHVLHLGLPKFYVHSVVETDGTLTPQSYYKQAGASKPELKNLAGRIVVRGGIKTDRHGNGGIDLAAPTPSQGNPNRIRNATERPAGLPR